jgi:hypothetical protein
MTAPVAANPAKRRLRELRLQLARVARVGHQGHVYAVRLDLLEQAHQVVGVDSLDEALRPVGQRLRADADARQVRQPGRRSGSM